MALRTVANVMQSAVKIRPVIGMEAFVVTHPVLTYPDFTDPNPTRLSYFGSIHPVFSQPVISRSTNRRPINAGFMPESGRDFSS